MIVHCDRNGKVPLTVPDELPLELHNTGDWSGNFFVFTTKRQLNLNMFAIKLKNFMALTQNMHGIVLEFLKVSRCSSILGVELQN